MVMHIHRALTDESQITQRRSSDVCVCEREREREPDYSEELIRCASSDASSDIFLTDEL